MRATMRRLALIALAGWTQGCSFFVEPVILSPDVDGGQDLAMQTIDDLAMPDLSQGDLATSVDAASPDLASAADLATCTPPVFPGFGGAVTSPFDCTVCGCVIDDFTNNTNSRWTRTASLGWSDLIGSGNLTISAANASNTTRDTVSSQGHFYLGGDFDLVVDYAIQTWPSGGGFSLAVDSTADAGTTSPVAIDHTYTVSGGNFLYIFVQGQTDRYIPTAQNSGTFEVTRAGNMVCAGPIGQTFTCGTVPATGGLFIRLVGSIESSSCLNNCTFQATFSNLRLKSGTIVSLP
jgi:hypothetical protein